MPAAKAWAASALDCGSNISQCPDSQYLYYQEGTIIWHCVPLLGLALCWWRLDSPSLLGFPSSVIATFLRLKTFVQVLCCMQQWLNIIDFFPRDIFLKNMSHADYGVTLRHHSYFSGYASKVLANENKRSPSKIMDVIGWRDSNITIFTTGEQATRNSIPICLRYCLDLVPLYLKLSLLDMVPQPCFCAILNLAARPASQVLNNSSIWLFFSLHHIRGRSLFSIPSKELQSILIETSSCNRTFTSDAYLLQH